MIRDKSGNVKIWTDELYGSFSYGEMKIKIAELENNILDLREDNKRLIDKINYYEKQLEEQLT